jgi:hypothetical protein
MAAPIGARTAELMTRRPRQVTLGDEVFFNVVRCIWPQRARGTVLAPGMSESEAPIRSQPHSLGESVPGWRKRTLDIRTPLQT